MGRKVFNPTAKTNKQTNNLSFQDPTKLPHLSQIQWHVHILCGPRVNHHGGAKTLDNRSPSTQIHKYINTVNPISNATELYPLCPPPSGPSAVAMSPLTSSTFAVCRLHLNGTVHLESMASVSEPAGLTGLVFRL